ncbi:unnamed protein product [Wuchereria bancrofti]|uniref:Uncharacterized protein n=1 Tax=Wuchereria bancrofti TaxID=6293 RepID=A0A3P7F8M7_WUCBA|nr:unnamed protein product [Wuchereria bancrofti]
MKIGQFSNEENNLLKRNWERYATANNVDCSRAYEFAGGYSREMDGDERINLLVFQNKTNFVPAMCKWFSHIDGKKVLYFVIFNRNRFLGEGLNDRTGRQVISRMLIMYHPGEKNRPEWNDELEEQFEKLYAEGCSSRAISIRLQRSKAEVDYRINLLRRRTEKPCDFDGYDTELTDSARQVLYGFVTKWLLPRNCPSELEEMLPEKETWNVADFALLQDQEKAISYLPWLSLTWKMLRPVPVIKKFWLKEVERLRAACERFDGDTEKATDACMPKLPLISVGEYRRALSLFLEQKPMFPSRIDIEQLQKRIEEENLVGYCTNGLIEGEFLKRMLCGHIVNFRHATRVVNFNCVDWITVLIEYLTHLDGSLRKWHYSMKYVRELISQKLKKKHENVLISSNDTAMNADENNSLSYSAAFNRVHKYKEKNCISYINNDLEVYNTNSQTNEGSTASNVYTEYFTEELKNLIESRILLFDEQQQRNFAKKLRKIMKKDKKLEALRGLIEKMISILEDEQKINLIRKHQKIMRRFQKMQGAKNTKSDVHCEFNEAEMSNKSCNDDTVNYTSYSEGVIGMVKETKVLDSDIGFDMSDPLELQLEKDEANSKEKSKRPKKEAGVVGGCSILSGLNELVKPVQES